MQEMFYYPVFTIFLAWKFKTSRSALLIKQWFIIKALRLPLNLVLWIKTDSVLGSVDKGNMSDLKSITNLTENCIKRFIFQNIQSKT